MKRMTNAWEGGLEELKPWPKVAADPASRKSYRLLKGCKLRPFRQEASKRGRASRLDLKFDVPNDVLHTPCSSKLQSNSCATASLKPTIEPYCLCMSIV